MLTALWLVAAMLGFPQDRAPRDRASQDHAPQDRAVAPTQPLPYSHKTHLALGLKCADCHANPEPGDRMTFPETAKCMACHRTIAKDKPAIQKLAEFASSGQPIPWVRVYVVSAGVYWNHRSHLEAGEKCETCHGPVAQMNVMANVTNVTTMAGCVHCHHQRKAGTGCEFCHEGK